MSTHRMDWVGMAKTITSQVARKSAFGISGPSARKLSGNTWSINMQQASASVRSVLSSHIQSWVAVLLQNNRAHL